MPDIYIPTGPLPLLIRTAMRKGTQGSFTCLRSCVYPDIHIQTGRTSPNSEKPDLVPSNGPTGQRTLDHMSKEYPAEFRSYGQLQLMLDYQEACVLQIRPRVPPDSTLSRGICWAKNRTNSLSGRPARGRKENQPARANAPLQVSEKDVRIAHMLDHVRAYDQVSRQSR